MEINKGYAKQGIENKQKPWMIGGPWLWCEHCNFLDNNQVGN